MQENNWVITNKKGKVNLPIFYGNEEQVIPIYAFLVSSPIIPPTKYTSVVKSLFIFIQRSGYFVFFRHSWFASTAAA